MAKKDNVDRNSFIFTWTLEDANYFSKYKKAVVSPAFIVDDQYKLDLAFFPNGYDDCNFISVYVQRHDDEGPDAIKLEFEISVLDSTGTAIFSKKLFPRPIEKSSGQGFCKFIPRNEVFTDKPSNFLPHDTLTLRCQVWKSKEEMSKSGECFGRSQLCMERLAFVWNIPNFSKLPSDQRVTFPIKLISEESPSMNMHLFLTGGSCHKEKIQTEIITTEKNLVKFISCKFCMLDADGTASEYVHDEMWFDVRKAGQYWKLPFCLPKNKLMEEQSRYLPNDTLYLKCEFSMEFLRSNIEFLNCVSEHEKRLNAKPFQICETINTCCSKEHKGKSLDSLNSLIEDLKTMYAEGFSSDVRLQSGNEVFRAHKNILGARSPVFKAMFSNETEGEKKECIDVSDVDSDTVRCMLSCLYTDVVENLDWESASKLYAAADKYEVVKLKNKCSSILKEKLCLSNACDILLLADAHQDDDLKTIVRNLISKNDEEIINSEAWESLEKRHTLLAAETLRIIYFRKKDV